MNDRRSSLWVLNKKHPVSGTKMREYIYSLKRKELGGERMLTMLYMHIAQKATDGTN